MSVLRQEKSSGGDSSSVFGQPKAGSQYHGTGSGENPALCRRQFRTLISSFPPFLNLSPSMSPTLSSSDMYPCWYSSATTDVVDTTFVSDARSNRVSNFTLVSEVL